MAPAHDGRARKGRVWTRRVLVTGLLCAAPWGAAAVGNGAAATTGSDAPVRGGERPAARHGATGLGGPARPPAPARSPDTLALDSLALDRLVGLAHVWRTVAFFHPDAPERGGPWDRATVAAIPAVIQATDGPAYERALSRLLAVLDDPATRVLAPPSPPPVRGRPVASPQPEISWTPDSVLVVRVGDYGALADWPAAVRQLVRARGQAAGARGVVFDLRARTPIPAAATGMLEFSLASSRVVSSLLASPTEAPGSRTRVHHGFVPERGSTSGGYYSAFEVRDAEPLAPGGDRDVPTAFVVDSLTVLPTQALALQAAGRAVVVSVGPVQPGDLARPFTLALPLGVRAQVRLARVTGAAGGGDPRADLQVDTGGDAADDAPMDAALTWVLEGALPPATAPAGPEIPPPGPSAEPPPLETAEYPPLAERVFAAFRMWAVIELFFPYGALMDRDWTEVFREGLTRFAASPDAEAYHRSVAETYTHVQDGHGYVRSPVMDRVTGTAVPPLRVRWVEEAPVIVTVGQAAATAGARPGDVIRTVDGEDAGARTLRYARLTPGSTDAARLGRAVEGMLAGAEGDSVALVVERDGRVLSIQLPRAVANRGLPPRSGEVVRILQDNVGYVDLDRLTVVQVPETFRRLKDTRAIVFDMRGYPNGTAWAIAPYLAAGSQPPAALFDRPHLTGPGETGRQRFTFVQRVPPLPAGETPYGGPTVMLIDDRTLSQAEHTGLFLEAANGTEFVGTPSAGANGDVTNFTVPGGILLSFTGQSVRHADGSRLQRTGLQPHVPAAPTVEGLRAGRDQVLEAALQHLSEGLGRER